MAPKTRFSHAHQYDDARDAEDRAATNAIPQGESKTQQQYTAEADLNIMVKRMGITDGAVPPAALDPAQFGDFTGVGDFRDALDRVREAQDQFNALPADLRKRFGYDPALLMEFVNDPKNDDEAIRLGLLKRLTPEDPDIVVRRRQLNRWRNENPEEARVLGLDVPAGAPPAAPTPPQTPAA